MERKLGKFLYVAVCVVSSVVAAPEVTLRITDLNGQRIEEIGLNVPFLLDVEIAGEGTGFSTPMVETNPLIQLIPAGTSSSIRTINNVTTVKKNYRFTSEVSKEGLYTIGPASIENNGQVISSQSFQVEATRHQKAAAIQDHEKAFMRISSEKTTAYRGEKVPFIVRFYHLDSVRLDDVQEPKFTGCTATPLKGPTSGQETIDGVMYQYLEWKCTLYPHTPGIVTVAPIGARISIQEPINRNARLDVFSMMDHMLGGGLQQKVIYSNQLALDVQDLPPHDFSVVAVGTFSGLTAKVNLSHASEGEGIVYTLELVGSGNFSMISHPEILLPEGLKFYESNTKFQNLGADVSKKDYEYVVQGLTAGTYTIEPQTFTYFDVKQKTYRTLQTKPLTITIAPGVTVKQEQVKPRVEISPEQESEIFSVIQTSKWRFRPFRFIPWFWFLVITCLPFVLWMLRTMFLWWRSFQERNAPHFGYKNAFKKAIAQIKICKKQGNPAELYNICIELFAARLMLPTSEISEDRIERALEERGMSQEKILAWREFFADITAATFASSSTIDKENLCAILLEWVIKFETIL